MSLAIDLEPITLPLAQELILLGLALVCLGLLAWRRQRLNQVRVDRRPA